MKPNYNSAEGFNSNVWGPAFWHVLHTISFNYPPPDRLTDQDKVQYYQFVLSLKNVLPCRVCRDNYYNNLKKVGILITKNRSVIKQLPEMKSRSNFSKFLFRLHQEVSRSRGCVLPCTFNEMRDNYETFRAKCVPNSSIDSKSVTHGGCFVTSTPSRGVIRIVPMKKENESEPTFTIHPDCKKKPKKKTNKAVRRVKFKLPT